MDVEWIEDSQEHVDYRISEPAGGFHTIVPPPAAGVEWNPNPVRAPPVQPPAEPPAGPDMFRTVFTKPLELVESANHHKPFQPPFKKHIFYLLVPGGVVFDAFVQWRLSLRAYPRP